MPCVTALAATMALALPLTASAQESGTAPEMGPALEVLWETDLPAVGWGVTIDPEGRIWVSTEHSVFEIFDRDGNHLETWGTAGKDDGEFDFVNQYGAFGDVAFKPDGGFYVSDVDNARIQEFDADRAFVMSIGSFGNADGQFVSPDTIKLDAAGNLYVFDIARSDIQVFDPDGSHLRTFGSGEVGPFFDVDPDGTVYAVDESVLALNEYGPEGGMTTIADLAGLMGFATGIVRTADGRTFVASELSGGSGLTGPEHLAEVAADGSVARIWPNGGWNVAIDPDGERAYLPLEGKLVAYALPPE